MFNISKDKRLTCLSPDKPGQPEKSFFGRIILFLTDICEAH